MKKKLLKGAVVLVTGNVFGRVCMLACSIQVAWVLSKTDFGIGATLWLTANLLQMLSELGIDRMLVQADDGDDEHLGNVAQWILMTRGLACGLILFLLAYPCAWLFQRPDITWAFQWVALQPVIQGFRHRDIVRMQRRMEFGPTAWFNIVPGLTSALVAYPLAVWLQDFRVFLVIALGRATISTVISHLLAEHKYRLAIDSVVSRRFFQFGWPLLLNGVLVYAGTQGSQFIVACFYPAAQLAVFSVAVSLTWLPTMQLDSTVRTLGMPYLVAHRGHLPTFVKGVHGLTVLLAVLAAGMACLYILLGNYLVTWLYGAKYAEAIPLVAILGLVNVFRLFRVAAALTAECLGNTRLMMVVNISRIVQIGIGVFLAWQQFSLVQLCWSMLVIECLAWPMAFLLAVFWHEIPWNTYRTGSAVFVAAIAFIGAGYLLDTQLQTAWLKPCFAFVLAASLAAVAYWAVVAPKHFANSRAAWNLSS